MVEGIGLKPSQYQFESDRKYVKYIDIRFRTEPERSNALDLPVQLSHIPPIGTRIYLDQAGRLFTVKAIYLNVYSSMEAWIILLEEV